MTDEIVGGIRNALERGNSIEEAVQSFIDAGYNPDEVRESAEMIAKGSVSFSFFQAEKEAKPQAESKPQSAQQIYPQSQARPLPVLSVVAAQKKSHFGRTMLIVFLVLILLAIIGAIIYVIINPGIISSISKSLFGG